MARFLRHDLNHTVTQYVQPPNTAVLKIPEKNGGTGGFR